MNRTALASLFVVLSSTASAIDVISPSANASAMGGNANVYPFFDLGGPASVRYQQVFGAADFAGPGSPLLIMSIAFRPDQPVSGSIDFSGSLSLSTTGRTEGGLSTDFGLNVGADATTVFAGNATLTTSGTTLPDGTTAFDVVIPFTTPFLYDPSRGNLLIDFSTVPSHGTRVNLDAVDVDGDGTSRVGDSPGFLFTDSLGLIAKFEVSPVPEPPCLAALGLGTLAFLRRRVRR